MAIVNIDHANNCLNVCSRMLVWLDGQEASYMNSKIVLQLGNGERGFMLVESKGIDTV